MKVLFVITELYEGGAENALYRVAAQFRNRGHEVQVAALFGEEGAAGDRLRTAHIRTEGLKAHHWFYAPRAVMRLRQIINQFKPDVIQSWLFHANVTARFAAPASIPLICALRVAEPRLTHILLDRYTRKRVRHYVCVSESVARFAARCLRVRSGKITVVENGVALDEYKRAASEVRVPVRKKLQGLSVGRMTVQKGFDILLDGLAQLPRDSNWHWTFVGPQPDSKYVQKLKTQLKAESLEERVTLYGPVARERLVDFYRMANIVAVPSRWAGQPNIVLEAMASGIPVVTAETDGINDLLRQQENCVITVSPNTGTAWCDTLTKSIAAPGSLQAVKASADRLVQQRSWKKVATRYELLYKSAVAECRKE